MHYVLSRKHFLSCSILGGLSLAGFECTLDDTTTGGAGTGTSGGAGGNSSGTSSTGNGGSGGTTSSSSTTFSTGGSAGSAGSGGGPTGTGGSGGGQGGDVGQGGSSAGASGAGGAIDAGSDRSVDAGATDASIDGNASCTAQVAASISQNHVGALHGLSIPAADIMAGVTKIYATSNVPGMPPQTHMHYVQVTAQDFAMLKAGSVVTKKSCNTTTHQYVLQCNATPPAGGAPACNGDTTCGSSMTSLCP